MIFKRLMQIKEEQLQLECAILKTNTMMLLKLNQISEQLAYEALRNMQIKANKKR